MRDVLEPGAGSLSAYYEWFADAEHGAVLVYWTGDLQYDRQVEIDENDVLRTIERMERDALDITAKRIGKDANDGHLILTQKRLGVSVYEYRATRVRAAANDRARKSNDNLVPA